MDGEQLVGDGFVCLDEVVEVGPGVVATGEAAANGWEDR